jgi:anaerobic selenocysteine-containing dehydrogenase
MSMSGAAADEWLPAAPGTEGVFALAIARHLVEQRYRGADRADWAAALDRYTPAFVAEVIDLPIARIERVAQAFAGGKASLAIGGGTACSHTNAVSTLVAVNVLNYLVGNLGKPGGVVFNGEPAIGRDTQARHATYRTMLELADAAREGKIDVLIVNNTNPVFTMPDAAEFASALNEIPLIVSLSSFPDETTAMADVILPSHTYLESWGDSSPEPGVGFPVGAVSQPVVSPLYNTRATGDIILSLARQIGLGEALPWASMEDYLRDGWRAIHAQAAGGTEAFEPFWRDILRAGVWGQDTRRDHASVSVSQEVIADIDVGAPGFAGSEEAFPFVLYPYLSNALRDGRGANLPWLQELPDAMTSVVYGSWVELNPQTAAQLGVKEGDVLEVESPHGKIAAPVYVYPAIRPDVIAIPIGQGHTEYGRYARDRGVNPIRILAPQTEPETGALAWGATRVKLTRTGRHVELVKTGGESRELGRDIVQIASSEPDQGAAHSARLQSIGITVEPT